MLARTRTTSVLRAALIAVVVGLGASACSSTPTDITARPTPMTSDVASPVTPRVPVTTPPQATTKSPASTRSVAPTSVPPNSASSTQPATRTARSHADALPLSLATGSARQVITVVAASTSSTTATLRQWQRRGGGWVAVGPKIAAFVGTAGVTEHPNEATSATPIGSFTLTRAFGHDGNPGTALPYTRTTPADWWISQPGALYNTFQRCSSSCSFTQSDPNEHLYYETPAYDHAVVIDYNTRNSPTGVRQNAGSAFFLHVSEGSPTAGCVSVPAGDLVSIMRWLDPSAHPRILIGLRHVNR